MHVGLMHSTTGICVCCLASNGTNLSGMMMYKATQTHCNNPVVPTYSVWAHCVHGWQCRYQKDPVSFPFGGLEKTTRASPHHVTQHCPIGSETPPSYAPRSSRFGSKVPSVEDNVSVWLYAISELHARNDDDDGGTKSEVTFLTADISETPKLICMIVPN